MLLIDRYRLRGWVRGAAGISHMGVEVGIDKCMPAKALISLFSPTGSSKHSDRYGYGM